MNPDMFKLAPFCSLLISVSAKLSPNSMQEFYYPDDEDSILEIVPSKVLKLKDVLSEDLWVLEIDDFFLSSLTLWAGNMAEEKEFEDAFGSIIARYEERQRRTPKAIIRKQQKTEDTADDNEIIVKQNIMRLLNKFALSAMSDPNSYFTETEESNESPSLTLYFKGPYSSLVLNSGSMKSQFFISPPSPLPRWFYEKHYNAKRAGHAVYVKAPKRVEKDFYGSLLNLLHRFLSVPA